MEKKEKMSFTAIILGLSIWMILFSWEGSFSVQSLMPFIFMLLIYHLLKKNYIFPLNREHKTLLLLVGLIILSTAINSIRHIEAFTMYNLVGIIYFALIFLWYYLCTKEKYSKKEIKFIIVNYILVSLIISLMTINLSLSGVRGKIAITNLLGTVTDENLTSAIVSMAPVYIFTIILYDKNKFFMEKIFYYIAFIINILGICLTGSRAAMLGCILSLVLGVFIYITRKINLKKVIAFIIIFWALVLLAICAKKVMPEWIYNRYFASNYIDNSNTTRLKIWNNAIQGILDQPLLGFGAGTFSFLDEYQYTSGVSTPAHETFLDIAIYAGISGLLVFISFLYNNLKNYVLKKERRIYLPIIADLMFISIIIGATKSVFLWNAIILLKIMDGYMNENQKEETSK